MTDQHSNSPDQGALWSYDQTGAYLNKTTSALMTMRWRGDGPVAFRVGRHVRFRPSDVMAWVEAQVQDAVEAAR